MIISVEELREYVTTDKTDKELEAMLQALELSIRNNTHNNFQNRSKRFACNIVNGNIAAEYPYIRKGDTIQISDSIMNNGIYVYSDNMDLIDEKNCLVTKVEYPADVKMGVVNIIRWQLKNEAASNGDKSKKDIQSESISRHSVTYVTDATETDIDLRYGVPKKHVAFLKKYMCMKR